MKVKNAVWIRREFISQPNFDPTQCIRWKRKVFAVEILLQAFWDTITCTIRWNGREFFTSDSIHPLLNRITKWKFDKLEREFQDEMERERELELDPYPPLSYWE